MHQLINDVEKELNKSSTNQIKNHPTIEYEQLRRRIQLNIQEMYNYVNSELTKIQKNDTNANRSEHIDKVIQMTAEHKRSLIHDMNHLRTIDGYEEWRQNEAEHLSDLMQRRIKHVQNPEDCNTARKIVCSIHQVGLIKIILNLEKTDLSKMFFNDARDVALHVSSLILFIAL